MGHSPRGLAIVGASALILGFAALPAPVQAASLPCVLNCKFSVVGKRGRYLTSQVAPEQLTAADSIVGKAVSGSKSLAEESTSRGAIAGTGLKMGETQRALETMLARIRTGWPDTLRPPPRVSIRVIGATPFNPSARADNVIVVPLGVLMRAKSDDEVAWVMAHEYSHIGMAHFSREAEQRGWKSLVTKIVMGLQMAADMSQTRVDSSGQRMRVYTVEDREAQRFSNQAWAYSRDAGTALELINQGMTRRQEDQADAAGLDLVWAAKYSDVGFGSALVSIQEDETRAAAAATTFQQRLADATKHEAAKAVSKAGKGVDLSSVMQGFIQDVQRNFGRLLLDKVLDILKTSHRSAAVRKKGMNDYASDAYGDETFPKPQTVWLDAVRSTAEYKEASATVVAHDTALSLLETGSPTAVTDALAALKPALATRYAGTPLIANATAKIYEQKGDLALADQAYGLAETARAPAPVAVAGRGSKKKAAPPPVASPGTADFDDELYKQSLEGYVAHVTLLLKMKNYPKALSIIERAKDRFKDDTAFLPSLIAIYMQTKQTDKLATVITRCQDVEDDALSRKCTLAFYSDEQLKAYDALSPVEQAKLDSQIDGASNKIHRAMWWQDIQDKMKTAEE